MKTIFKQYTYCKVTNEIIEYGSNVIKNQIIANHANEQVIISSAKSCLNDIYHTYTYIRRVY